MVDVDIEAMSIDELEELRDACNRRILEMRRTTGLSMPELLRLLEEVKVALGDQGKEWHSLERWQWMDGEIRFWLNPSDHDLYHTGWFSIDDLIAWTREAGPVMVAYEDEIEEELEDTSDAQLVSWPLRWQSTDEDELSTSGDAIVNVF